MKKLRFRIFILSLFTVFCISFIYFLFVFSKVPNTYLNGFKRKFLDTSLLVTTYYRDLISKEYYLIGTRDRSIFIANYNLPNKVIELNDSFTSSRNIEFETKENALQSSIINYYDADRFLLADPKIRRIFTFDLAAQHDTSSLIYVSSTPRFNLTRPISGSTFLFRSPDSGLKRNILVKWNQTTGDFQSVTNVLKKQVDGFFCTDGLFGFDSSSHKIAYVYYYRNEFLILDTNLSILIRGNTIDTNRIAKIKVDHISSEDIYTFSAPPITVNQQIYCSNGLLFIRSGLLADNEDRQVFAKSSVIDVYSLFNGKYRFSFYLLDFDGYKISDLAYYNHHIVAIQGHFITYFPAPF